MGYHVVLDNDEDLSLSLFFPLCMSATLSVIPYLCLHDVCLHPCLISIYLCLCLPQSLSQTAYLRHSLSLSYCPLSFCFSVSDNLFGIEQLLAVGRTVIAERRTAGALAKET